MIGHWVVRDPAPIQHRSSTDPAPRPRNLAPLVTIELRTFLAEDSPVIRENLVAALEEMAPIRVVGMAPDEAGAIAWLSDPANACDLGIIDIFLSRGTGLGVIKAVRERNARIKLVVLSNFATAEMRRKCLELGADKVFDKSNEIDALIRYCARLAGNQGDAGDSEEASLGAGDT
jgi:DNA-binding NarL/FixJ family response regulator